MIAVTPAMTNEKEFGDKDAALAMRVGSGNTDTAPMAVKCMETIASVE